MDEKNTINFKEATDNQILISVVVPAFNCQKTIENCLNSILIQSIIAIQVIVVDDGSKDNTYALIQQLSQRDERILAVHQNNAGTSAARNHGIELAEGLFLIFVDADDVILPGMFNALLYYQREYNADLVISGIRKIIKNESKRKAVKLGADRLQAFIGKTEIQLHFVDMMRMNINNPVGRIYNMTVIRHHQLSFNEQLDIGEDLQFNLDYIDKISNIVFIPDIFYQYNTFNSILTFKYREDLFNKRKISIQLLNEFLEKNKIDKNLVYYSYIKLIYASAMQEIEHSSITKKRICEIKKNLKSQEIKMAVKNFCANGVIEKIMCFPVKVQMPYCIDFMSRIFSWLRKSGGFFDKRISV